MPRCRASQAKLAEIQIVVTGCCGRKPGSGSRPAGRLPSETTQATGRFAAAQSRSSGVALDHDQAGPGYCGATNGIRVSFSLGFAKQNVRILVGINAKKRRNAAYVEWITDVGQADHARPTVDLERACRKSEGD